MQLVERLVHTIMSKPALARRLRSFSRLGAAGLFSLAIVATSAAPNPVSGPKSMDGYQTAAPHAILIDVDSGSVLFEKGADELIPPD